MADSKCFDCYHAKDGTCAWVYDKKPISGWTAKRITLVNYNGENIVSKLESYIVKDCPNFKRDNKRINSAIIAKGLGIAVYKVGKNRKAFIKEFNDKYAAQAERQGIRFVYYNEN